MKLRDLIFRDLRLKLFSLLIAVLIWETVHVALTARRPGEEAPRPPPSPTNAPTR